MGELQLKLMEVKDKQPNNETDLSKYLNLGTII